MMFSCTKCLVVCRLKNFFHVTIYMSCNELHNLHVFSCNELHESCTRNNAVNQSGGIYNSYCMGCQGFMAT